MTPCPANCIVLQETRTSKASRDALPFRCRAKQLIFIRGKLFFFCHSVPSAVIPRIVVGVLTRDRFGVQCRLSIFLPFTVVGRY